MSYRDGIRPITPPGRIACDPRPLGKHLATLNLFREPDGSVHITCAEARGAMEEPDCLRCGGAPVDYVNRLIVQAARNLEK